MPIATPRRPVKLERVVHQRPQVSLRQLRDRVTKAWKSNLTAVEAIREQRTKYYDLPEPAMYGSTQRVFEGLVELGKHMNPRAPRDLSQRIDEFLHRD